MELVKVSNAASYYSIAVALLLSLSFEKISYDGYNYS